MTIQSGSSNLLKVTLDDIDESRGAYTLSVTADGTNAGTVTVFVKAVMKAGLTSDLKEVGSYYFQQKVTVDDRTLELNLNGTPKVGVLFDGTLTESGEKNIITGNVEDHKWYAENLPDGLSMSYDGHITGVPTKEISQGSAGDTTVTVVLKDTNAVYKATLKIGVQAADKHSFNYSLYKGDSPVTSGSNTYTFVQGDVVKLKVYKDTESTPVTDAKVYVSYNGDTISLSQDSESSGTYTLDTKGTGAYHVTITQYGVSESFYVYVLPGLDGLNPGIVIVPSP